MLTQVQNTVKGNFVTNNEDIQEILEALRIKEERELYHYLRDTLSVDVINPIIYKKENTKEDTLLNFVNGNFLKISENFGPHIYDTCMDVVASLGLEHLPLDFYLEINPVLNAYAYHNYKTDEPHFIVFTSGLIDNLDMDELRVVIGHELAHIIYHHYEISRVIDMIFAPDNNISDRFLYNLYLLWVELAQMSADRLGLLVVYDFDAAVRANFKISTGLTMNKMNTTTKHYIKMMGKVIEELKRQNNTYAMNYHPSRPVRTKALETFFNSSTRSYFIEKRQYMEDTNLIDETSKLIEKLQIRPKNEIENAEFEFLLSSGYLIMTAEDGWDAYKNMCLLDLLSWYHIDPRDIIKDAIDNRKVSDLFENSLSLIKEQNKSDTSYLYSMLTDLIARDNKIREKEVSILIDIANELGIPEEKAIDMILESLRKNYKPSIIMDRVTK